MKKVTLSKADSCITYVLKRIGIHFDSTEIINQQWFAINHFTETQYFANYPLKIGDILAWKSEPSNTFAPIQINESGQIIYEKIPTNKFHVAVYEGHSLVSDMTFYEYSKTSEHPIVRMRELSQLKAPDYILSHNFS